ncbi:MAG: PEGA domain-containing protein [Deltaproteobacteria bacterium]|nr:PEGA domain-containing protein [Deltaproteobacteria bacterium]
MTTGVPIYLVSACVSGEEFVAAFRRYADRNGLFVPIAQPIPAGLRGRFAVTLTTGGVMLEGDAEIVSSGTSPSVLHGRTGMTLRFLDPDIKTKTVLGELEAARLARQPGPPSVPPRPADVPPQPRPVPPAPSGRIDANTALAECVAIGDVEALEAAVAAPLKAGPRFVVPTIPPAAVPQRPRTPSSPPLFDRPASASGGVPIIRPASASGSVPVVRQPSASASGGHASPDRPRSPSQSGPYAAARATTGSTPPPLGPPPTLTQRKDSGGMRPLSREGSSKTAQLPVVVMPPASAAIPVAQSAPVAQPPSVPVPQIDDELVPGSQARDTEMMMMAVVPPDGEGDVQAAIPEPVSPSTASGSTSRSNSARLPLPRRTSNTSPPLPRNPTPSAALPVVVRLRTPSGPAPIATRHPAQTPLGVAIAPPPPAAPAPAMAPAPTPLPTPTSIDAVPQPPTVAAERPRLPEVEVGEPTDITEFSTLSEPHVADADPGEVFTLTGPPVVIAPIGTEPGVGPQPAVVIPGATQPAAVPSGTQPGVGAQPAIVAAPSLVDSGRVDRQPRKTVIGVAVVPDGVMVLPAASPRPMSSADDEGRRDTAAMATPEPTGGIVGPASVDSRAKTVPPEGVLGPEIQEPTGDWTMTPGADAPTILPRKKSPTDEPALAAPAPAPVGADGDDKKLPTGDWTIARVVDAPDGWSEPSKVDKPAYSRRVGSMLATVSGEKPLEVTSTARSFEIEEATKSGINVEIDATLTAPLPDVLNPPPIPHGSRMQAMSAPAMPHGASLSQPIASSYVTPLPPAAHLGDRITGAGAGMFSNLGDGSMPQGESTAMLDRDRRKRTIIVIASCAFAIIAGIVAVLTLGSNPDKVAGDGSAAKLVQPAKADLVTPDAAAVAVPVLDAGATATTKATDAAAEAPALVDAATAIASTDCIVELTSVPPGAEIVHDRTVVGTTPAKLTLPCGVAAKLALRKARFVAAQRVVTPSAKPIKLRVALAKTTFSVKVSSTPTGATITSNGKSLGVTPAAVKLPAFEASTILITKDGFTPESQTITPKQNNQAVHTALKKKRR